MTAAPTGVIDGMPDAEYHRHPALSVSGARLLLPPSCPARFKYDREHPPEPKPYFDFGHAAHAEVLGEGLPIVEVKADDWKSTAAQKERKQIHADGKVPLLTKEIETVRGMAAALRLHPLAAALLRREAGDPEKSLFWDDPETGVPLRARLDFFPHKVDGRRLIVADYKTAASAYPGDFGKSAANYGYAMQDDFYRAGIRALEIDEDPAFVFVVQEKTAPFLVATVALDTQAKEIGRSLNRRAINIFRDCTEADNWPSYTPDEIEQVSLPGWFVYQNEELS